MKIWDAFKAWLKDLCGFCPTKGCFDDAGRVGMCFYCWRKWCQGEELEPTAKFRHRKDCRTGRIHCVVLLWWPFIMIWRSRAVCNCELNDLLEKGTCKPE